MSASKKLIQAAAGNAGEALYVEDVFSTYLWEGNGVAGRSIVNNIDVDGEGGLVWIKNRDTVDVNGLYTTDRGANKTLVTNETSAEDTVGTDVFQAFNSNGFTVGSHGRTNSNGNDYVSWTFRKAPKFFDVVTYTGNGATSGSPLTINHALEATVGTILVKQLTDNSTNWFVYHRSLGTNSFAILNLTNAAIGYNGGFNNVTSTSFDVFNSNATSGKEFVAYLFAHNDGDGEFGEDADQDIIKCGSYTEAASGVQEIDVGFEPQWLLVKSTSLAADWYIYDVMRGQSYGGSNKLEANTSDAEASQAGYFAPTPNGFIARLSGSGYFGSGENVIYIAIRRGPMKTPESGTEVFAVDTRGATGGGTPPALRSGFPVDWVLWRNNKNTSGSTEVYTRMLASYLITNTTAAEVAYSSSPANFAFNNGWFDNTATDSNDIAWMFRRAPGFFDVVAYEGDGVAGRTVSHNLGVAPEMMWVKNRDTAYAWKVYHSTPGETKYAKLSDRDAFGTATAYWNDTAPTDSVFTVGTGVDVNASGDSIIAYLFATLPGVSKVGSYTGNGSSQTIDCGFSAGARFVLTKRTNTTGNWNVWDSERGIVAGNDPRLELNTTDAEDTGHDYIDPDNSGFIVNYVADDDDDSNVDGDEYIFLAIA